MLFDLRDKVAVVTGAASGIGSALSRRLAELGAHVVMADLEGERLAESAAHVGGTAVPTDVSDPDAMERLAAAAPGAAIVCLNAGVVSTSTGPVWEAPPEEWRRVLDVNLGGVVNGLRAFVPRLLGRDSGERAHILITASLAGLATWPGGGPYAASKHAVVAVAEQAALSLADTPVGVTVLCPALVRSGMSDVGDDPAAVADAALAAVAAGHFAVLPDEWRDAVRERGRLLADGLAPELPRFGRMTS